MNPHRKERLIAISCVMALTALLLMSWSVLDPRPVPVILAMSLGQALGTGSLILFLVVVGLDLKKRRVLEEPPDSEPTP